MDAYSSLIVQMAENRVRDLRREAAGRGARRWFPRRPAGAEPRPDDDVVVDGARNAGGAWYYRAPKEAAAEIKDRVAFWRGIRVE